MTGISIVQTARCVTYLLAPFSTQWARFTSGERFPCHPRRKFALARCSFWRRPERSDSRAVTRPLFPVVSRRKWTEMKRRPLFCFFFYRSPGPQRAKTKRSGFAVPRSQEFLGD